MTDLNLTPEQQLEIQEKLPALQAEYKPRIVTALQDLGLQIDDDISDEELTEILNDESAFAEKLPEGTSIEDLTPEDVAPLQEVLIELAQRAQEIILEVVFG